MNAGKIPVHRTPVLTLWAAVVAERCGQAPTTALSLGKSLAALTAHGELRTLGGASPTQDENWRETTRKPQSSAFWVMLCGLPVPACHTREGTRGMIDNHPVDPAQVEEGLRRAFGEHLTPVREALTQLASAYTPEELDLVAYTLYERFRPQVDTQQPGFWHQGMLDLELLQSMARKGKAVTVEKGR